MQREETIYMQKETYTTKFIHTTEKHVVDEGRIIWLVLLDTQQGNIQRFDYRTLLRLVVHNYFKGYDKHHIYKSIFHLAPNVTKKDVHPT